MTSHSLTYRGSAGALVLLALRNFFLTLITLGLYLPWARTATRRFLFENILLGQKALRFEGTGFELFTGYCKGILLLGLGLVIQAVAQDFGGSWGLAVRILCAALGVFVFVPLILLGRRAYLMARTCWGEWQFSFSVSRRLFVSEFARGLAFSLLTAGLYFPFFLYDMSRLTVRSHALGGRRFEFLGSRRESVLLSYRNFALCLVTLGLYLPWASVARSRYFVGNLAFGEARFGFEMSGSRMLVLILAQGVLVPCSLGLAAPWVRTFRLRALCAAIRVSGDLEAALQESDRGGVEATADSLADLLDFDLGFEM